MPATIYHVKTNNVPDSTETSIVRPSDWNSAHAVTLSPTGQEIIGAFSNGGNVTFGTNPSGFVTASAPSGGAGDGGNVIAVSGSTANSTGTIVFNNGNNVTFGMNAGTVTASASFNQTVDTNKAGTGFTSTTTAGTAVVGTLNTNGLSIGVPTIVTNALTTAAQSNHSHNLATTTTNGSQIVIATTNSAGATMAVPPFITTYVNDLTSGRAGTGFTSTTTGGTAVVGTLNTNGLSIGVPTIITNAITTARASNDGIGLNTANSNVTWTVNSGGISLDGRGYAGTASTFNGTNVSGSITQNSNGLRLDLSVGAGGAADGYNSAQFTNATANSTMPLVWAGNSNGSGNVTVGLTGSTITMSAPTGGGAGDGYNIIGVNGGATQLSTTYQFNNANNVTFGLNAGTITASASYAAQTVDTNKAGTGFTSTTTAGTAVVGTLNTNGLSIGVPTIITNALTSQSVQTNNLIQAVSASGTGANSTQLTNTSNAGLLFSNANGVTFSLSGNSMGASVNTAYIPLANSNNYFYTSNNTFANSTHSHGNPTLNLTNITGTTASASNGLTLSLSGVAAQTTQTQPAGNIAGVGTTFGGTNVSGSMTLNSNGLALSLSAPTPGGGGAINVSAGTTSGNLQTIQFNNGNGVSFGLNGSTVTGSVNAGGGGTTVSWYPPLPLPIATSTMVSGTSGNTGGSFQTTAHMYVGPMQLQQALTFGEVEIIASHAALSAGTGSVTVGHQLGIYTLNGGTALSLVSSFEWNCVLSQNSVTAVTVQHWWGTNSTSNSSGITGNSSASLTGPRVLKLYDSTGSLPAGDYWVAQCMTHRSSSVNIASGWFTGAFLSQSQSTAGASYFGNSTIGNIMRNIGIVSTTQNNANSLRFAMPTSIATTAITGTGGTSQMRVPIPRFYL